MMTIRVIMVDADGNVLSDKKDDFVGINLQPLDVPAYVRCELQSNLITCVFSNTTEKPRETLISYDGLSDMTFGKNSSRLMHLHADPSTPIDELPRIPAYVKDCVRQRENAKNFSRLAVMLVSDMRMMNRK